MIWSKKKALEITSKEQIKDLLDKETKLSEISNITTIDIHILKDIIVNEYKIFSEDEYELYKNKMNSISKVKMHKEKPRTHSDESKKKTSETLRNRYEDKSKKEEFLEKHHKTSLKNNGFVSCFENKEIQNNIKKTNLEKYGSEYYMGSKDFIKKSEDTKLERYGNEHYVNPKKISESLKKMTYSQRLERFKRMKNSKLKKYGTLSLVNMDKVKETCLEKYGVPYNCMTEQCVNSGSVISSFNKKFSEVLNEFDIENEFEFKIENLSYDIKIKNSNILIEIDPTYTHNSTIGPQFSKFKRDPVYQQYHSDKTKLALDNGYHCIHVFDWDDWNKIINLINPNKEVIYARKCKIKEVSKEDTKNFENTYHLQNYCQGQEIRIGLYYNEELVELMTFGKPRYNKNYQYELLRLCSSDKQVTGGSQKLFKYFIDNYNPESIISYCDNSKFSGEVYKKLGFELKDFGKPTCIWFNGKNKITDNLLRQRGADQLLGTNYGKGTSNKEIMIDHGFVEVYDCGQSVWVWKNNLKRN